MGGNALKVPTVRLDNSRYQSFANSYVERIRKLRPGVKVAAIPSYSSKPTHGDLDIVVGMHVEGVYQLMADLGNYSIVRNGPVTSFGVVLDEGVFQVDVLCLSPEIFDFALKYYSYNDLGNLIGRTAKQAGMSHTHHGLYYDFWHRGERIDRILLTRDYQEALTFLGYSYERFQQGFGTLDDIYNYVGNSLFFRVEDFLFVNRDHRSRVRDAKRPTYTGFLDWCRRNERSDTTRRWLDKRTIVETLKNSFPHFGEAFEAKAKYYRDRDAIKAKFSGDVVRDVLGIDGMELGDWKRRFSQAHGGTDGMIRRFTDLTSEEARQVIADFQ